MACANCQALRAELAEARRRLGEETAPGRLARLAEGLKVSPTVAVLINRLDAAGGDVVRADALLRALRGEADEVHESWLAVYVGRARSVLGEGTIANVWSVGYRLTPAGAAVVAAVLDGAVHRPAPRRGSRRRFADAAVREIRGSAETLGALAARHGVTEVSIWRIRHRRAYADVDDDAEAPPAS